MVGESVDGWELTSVDPRSVRFKSVAGGSQAELNMSLATGEVLSVPKSGGGRRRSPDFSKRAATRGG